MSYTDGYMHVVEASPANPEYHDVCRSAPAGPAEPVNLGVAFAVRSHGATHAQQLTITKDSGPSLWRVPGALSFALNPPSRDKAC